MTKSTKTALEMGKEPGKPRGGKMKPKEKKRRNFKIRPTEPDGLITALRTNVLDQRTRPARELLALRDITAAEPFAVTLALARDVFSVNALIVQSLARHLTGPDAQILDKDGNVHELVVRHWPEAQSMLLKAARELRRMEMEQGKRPVPNNPDGDATIDLSAILISEAEAKSDENDQ